MTTKVITFLIGNPNLNLQSFTTGILVRGPHPTYTIFAARFLPPILSVQRCQREAKLREVLQQRGYTLVPRSLIKTSHLVGWVKIGDDILPSYRGIIINHGFFSWLSLSQFVFLWEFSRIFWGKFFHPG